MTACTRLALLLLLALPAGVCAADAQARHVVVISIDGLPAYLLDDPQASLPVIRGLRASGSAASGGMRVSNPSVTWPNHTTLMTGVHPDRHGVLFNGALERLGPGMPVKVVPAKGQKDLVRVPLLFDILKGVGIESAAINWPCTRDSESIADNFPDVSDMLQYTSPRLKKALEVGGFLQRFDKGGGVVRDEVWTEAACRVIRDHKPRLLTLHLLNLDSIHHRYGPKSPAGYTAAAFADAMVGLILAAINDAGLRDRTAVFIVSDHGFASVKKTIKPNAVLRREGLIRAEGSKVISSRVYVVPEGGIAMVYLTAPETADADRDAVRRLFKDAEGVAAIVEPADFPRYHFPRLDQVSGMADLVLAAKDGYAFSGAVTGDAAIEPNEPPTGTHGYLSTEPKMNAFFVASGPGIKAGQDLGIIDNIDVAPTVAKLLGVSLPGVSGRVLEEIIEGGAR